MIVEIPEELAVALKTQALAHGLSPDGYVREVLERDLGGLVGGLDEGPFETGRGILAKYGEAPSAEEIDANRAEMFRNFGASFD